MQLWALLYAVGCNTVNEQILTPQRTEHVSLSLRDLYFKELIPEIHYKIVEAYKQLRNLWDALVTHDVFLKSSFLAALEQFCPINITPFYVAIFREEILVGVAIVGFP